MSPRYNPPPNWPAPPAGWTPPPGWQPEPSWGPAPEGWQLWVDDDKRPGWFARHKVLTGLGVGVAVLVVAIGASGGGDDAKEAAVPEQAASEPAAPAVPEKPAQETAPEEGPEVAPVEEAPALAPLGTPVRDGKFEFVVHGTECGVTTVGDEFLNQTAQGEYCLVRMSVTNIGDESQYFFGDNQEARNDAGQEFSSDSTAAIYLENSDSWMSEINPGNAVEAVVVFDVPPGTALASIDLHDSAFSGGVEASLR
ncbi:DUF4352 domain-containing protein [Cellulomonas biazotea]|uniref:DUF4352 domain-containing protein n=1 Tax=Cellulomonas biazotea TaxID=1709 RepID=A0A402DU87_9CELL|nr:DUF4352 domain-containing protein [Cellulomonas biazotea]GCE77652.1 hypothetical protein CBZ_27080 [Cellulomonas biazotea]